MWARLRWWWRRVPGRTRLGVVVAVVAIAGLAWQHYDTPDVSDAPTARGAASSAAVVSPVAGDDPAVPAAGDAGRGELGRTSSAAAADYSPDAARSTAARFAANFASPTVDREEWLARIGPDVTVELLDQYRLGDVDHLPGRGTGVVRIDAAVASNPTDPTFHVDFGDGSGIETTLAMGDSGWRVSGVVPVVAGSLPETVSPVSGIG